MELDVRSIEICDRVRARRRKDAQIVERYAEDIKVGAIMPPIVVFQENGTQRYLCADGEHRLEAHKKAGKKKIDAEIHKGDEVDALEYALGCNATHGTRRTAADIKFAYHQLRDNPALSGRYKTHQARSDLLRVSVRTCQRLEAEWREAEGGDKTEKATSRRAAKTKGQKPRTARHANGNNDLGNMPPSGGMLGNYPTSESELGLDWQRLKDAWQNAKPETQTYFARVMWEL